MLFVLLGLLAGCASRAIPTSQENICHIFEEKRGWHYHALQMNKTWGVPVHVPMAMMYQESSFRHNARPPRRKILGFIPGSRPSNARGYSQALTATWDDYRNETGNRRASRTNFADSIDFMGWYISKTHSINGVSKWDAENQYLNYHEGWGGYRRGTHRSKPWLLGVAKRVDARARTYSQQYQACSGSLSKRRFF
ncbi:MAG: hypothetical protein EA348_10345 [Pseudomonadaceae bacterium]|nr:MAG: hypothetical protein EA348_10345 [Pseudomonadaceae bacterium]